jgi:alpha-tubulin suppressor-like RCC1 family protein
MGYDTTSRESVAVDSALASANVGSTGPKILQVIITDSSYNDTSATAVALTGGYIKIIGTQFATGGAVYVGGEIIASTVVSPNEIRMQLPAAAASTKSLIMFNADTSGAIYASGIVYSSIPVWGTSSYSTVEYGSAMVVNVQLLATGDVPLSYSLQGGSSLPTGVTLSSAGLISGTATAITTSTTVTFTVVVSDPQLQAVPQLISLTMTFYVGKLYSWGNNNYGQLGLGSTNNASAPNQVGSLTTWKMIETGYYSNFAIKTDGTLWAWGRGLIGVLGLGNASNYSSPKQVGALTNWLTIAGGSYNAIAIKTNGTLWTWGINSAGSLGQGDTNHRSSPVQVGSLTNWAEVSVSDAYSLAVKTDGTLWSWGNWSQGSLGLGTSNFNRSSPVQVGTSTNWKTPTAGGTAGFAIKTDGTLWAWGINSNSQLGLAGGGYRNSPVQVGVLTTWASVSTSGTHTLAITTAGTLWAWGTNLSGELGLTEVTTDKSIPVQVGLLTNWKSVSTSVELFTTATKTNGTLWGWGNAGPLLNRLGQYGSSRSSPIQVGALTTWVSTSSGRTHTIAISG